MSPGDLTERAFEERIEAELAKSGWRTSIGSADGLYDAEIGIHTGTLWEFVSKTQVKSWNRLIERYGGDPDYAQSQFARRVASEIDSRGTLDVLREGVKDRGVLIELCYFKPGHTLAENALAEYNENILLAARQFHFSARDRSESVDFALLVNGLPVATIELKNQSTGQDAAKDATAQYRERNPDDLFFARRALVHFAVDPDWALITTRLRGKDTEFLPFNVGSNGPGVSGGAGNPSGVRENGYAVDYLWRDIWQRENWLEILQRFMHVETTDKKRAKLNPHTSKRIFPRFHQWHAVQRLVAHAREHGAGNNYLVEHSAGSGKSNTIAWLAYRLSNLYDAGNQPVFHKVVVITDRTVLDRQLQQTIFQFDHTPGVVKRIDEDSAQLADALGDSTSKIVISTLQKYPYVLDKIIDAGLGGKRYAVIIDEAHSSQSGNAATRLKQAIGENAQSGSGDDEEDPAVREARIRGPQPNLSYFAFTATPKNPTLKLFGRWDPDAVNPRKPGERGMHVPFHVYSMRQAIEEGYILDVLANYITYESKWRLREAARERFIDDPEVDERKAKARLVKLAVMHPTSVAQRARLIVEDFRDNLGGRLGGRAKAMVVCSGRQHALEMFQEIRKWCSDLPGCGFGVLVAFSGSLSVDGVEFTEAQLNGFGESQLPDRFAYVKADDPVAASRNREEYRILVVADKYQTGFDQPLLCGMYVDKQLAGVAAVQTLSRLNRIHPLKTQDDVRILDFANPAERIRDSFLPWFETTIAEPEDPNILYDRQRKVMEYGLLVESEMESFLRVLAEAGPGQLPSAAERALHAKLHQYLTPAIDRFAELDEHDQGEFRKALTRYVRMYSLVAQLIDWGDPDLERLYQYGRVLLIRLPGRPQDSVDIGDADLSHYRLEKTGEQNLSLSPASGAGDGVVPGYSDGGGGYREPEIRPLSEIIGELNDRFGLGLSSSDEILVYQQVLGLVEDPKAQQVGLMNDEARFGQVADDKLDDIVAENAERNTEFIKLYFDNPEFQKAVKEAARKRAYKIITDPARDEALARLRAEMGKETGV